MPKHPLTAAGMLPGCCLWLGTPAAAQAQTRLVVGMNVVNPLRAKVDDQNRLIEQLKAAHVRVIRCGIGIDDKSIDFARRVYAAGIRIELIVSPQYPPDAPSAPYRPLEFPGVWGGHPLSYADPALSLAFFRSLLQKLDAADIRLEAIELGNEINWTSFNAEFPVPGKGRIFSYDDLSSDPEARQVAKGYLQYIRILAALRQARDASSLNRGAPILSAGLSDPGQAKASTGGNKDAVTINATIQFLRAHGMDQYVDGYGIHQYPWQATPQARKAALLSNALDVCGTGAPGQAKPCWITEWGLNNKDMTCPLDDQARARLAQETMNNYREAAKAGIVAGVMYFSWSADAWAKEPSASSAYRCDAETATARAALQP